MKVEFLKPAKGYAHVPGEVCEMEDEQATKMIEGGFVVQAKEKTEKAVSKEKTEKAVR